MMPTDSYVTQRLALATYKSKLPTPEAALHDAAAILDSLEPAASRTPRPWSVRSRAEAPVDEI